jgi:hypothetical protein
MERYGSDMNIHHFVTEDEAIEHCAQVNASTRFEQEQGKDAWEHYFVFDGFEKQIQINQCYNPETDGPWTSQSRAECFVEPSSDMREKIKSRSEEIYSVLVENHKHAEKIKQQKDADERLQREIANAKALLQKHSI